MQNGVSTYEVSQLLGHVDIKTTQIYAHLRSDDLRNADARLEKKTPINFLCLLYGMKRLAKLFIFLLYRRKHSASDPRRRDTVVD
jgi:hypothetical protein